MCAETLAPRAGAESTRVLVRYRGREEAMVVDGSPLPLQLRGLLRSFEVAAGGPEDHVLTMCSQEADRCVRTLDDLMEAKSAGMVLELTMVDELVEQRLARLQAVLPASGEHFSAGSLPSLRQGLEGLFWAVYGSRRAAVHAMSQGALVLLAKVVEATLLGDDDVVEVAMTTWCEVCRYRAEASQAMSGFLRKDCDVGGPRFFRRLVQVLLGLLPEGSGDDRIIALASDEAPPSTPPCGTLHALLGVLEHSADFAHFLHAGILGDFIAGGAADDRGVASNAVQSLWTFITGADNGGGSLHSLYPQLLGAVVCDRPLCRKTVSEMSAWRSEAARATLTVLVVRAQEARALYDEVKKAIKGGDKHHNAAHADDPHQVLVALKRQFGEAAPAWLPWLRGAGADVGARLAARLVGGRSVCAARSSARLERRCETLGEINAELRRQLRAKDRALTKLAPFVKVPSRAVNDAMEHLLTAGWGRMHFKDGYTLLHYVAEHGKDPMIADMLFAFATRPDAPDDAGNTPLDYARRAGDDRMIAKLEQLYREFEEDGLRASAPPLGAAQREALRQRLGGLRGLPSRLHDRLEQVLDAGPSCLDGPRGFTAVHLAAQAGAAEAVRWLLDAGAGLYLAAPDELGLMPVDYAVQSGHAEAVQAIRDYLLDASSVDPPKPVGNLGTAEITLDTASVCLPRDAAADAPLADEATPEVMLRRAIANVLQRGWESISWPHNFSALHLAARQGSALSVLFLLQARASAGLDAADARGRRPIDYARQREDAEDVVQALLGAPFGVGLRGDDCGRQVARALSMEKAGHHALEIGTTMRKAIERQMSINSVLRGLKVVDVKACITAGAADEDGTSAGKEPKREAVAGASPRVEPPLASASAAGGGIVDGAASSAQADGAPERDARPPGGKAGGKPLAKGAGKQPPGVPGSKGRAGPPAAAPAEGADAAAGVGGKGAGGRPAAEGAAAVPGAAAHDGGAPAIAAPHGAAGAGNAVGAAGAAAAHAGAGGAASVPEVLVGKAPWKMDVVMRFLDNLADNGQEDTVSKASALNGDTAPDSGDVTALLGCLCASLEVCKALEAWIACDDAAARLSCVDAVLAIAKERMQRRGPDLVSAAECTAKAPPPSGGKPAGKGKKGPGLPGKGPAAAPSEATAASAGPTEPAAAAAEPAAAGPGKASGKGKSKGAAPEPPGGKGPGKSASPEPGGKGPGKAAAAEPGGKGLGKAAAPDAGGKGPGKGAAAAAAPAAGAAKGTAKGKAAGKGPPEKGGPTKGGPAMGKAKASPKGKAQPTKPKLEPKLKMKTLHWNFYIYGKDLWKGETVWDDVQDWCGVLPPGSLDAFENAASSAPKKEPKAETKEKKGPDFIRVVTGNDLQTAEMGLRSCPPVGEAAEALQEFDDGKLSLEQLKALRKFGVADDKKFEMLKGMRESMPDVPLATVEQYMWVLGTMPGINERLESWIVCREVSESAEFLIQKLRQAEYPMDCLMQSESFPKFLSCFLAVGNFLNGGSNKGQADGFSFNDMKQGYAFRASNGVSLARAILQVFHELDAEGLDKLVKELQPALFNVKRTAVMQEGTLKIVKTMRSQFEDLTTPIGKLVSSFEAARTKATAFIQTLKDDSDTFTLLAPKMFDRGAAMVKQLTDTTASIEKKFKALMAYLKAPTTLKTDGFFIELLDEFFLPADKLAGLDANDMQKIGKPMFLSGKTFTTYDLLVFWKILPYSEKEAAKQLRKEGVERGELSERVAFDPAAGSIVRKVQPMGELPLLVKPKAPPAEAPSEQAEDASKDAPPSTATAASDCVAGGDTRGASSAAVESSGGGAAHQEAS